MCKAGSLHIATVGGIPIYIHWSFGILLVWVVLSALVQGGGDLGVVSWRILLIIGLVISVILHELGHAFAARYFHIDTQDITMYPFGGVASIEKMPEKPIQELVIAIAGPLVNFLITGLIFAGLFLLGIPFALLVGDPVVPVTRTLAGYFMQLAQLNILLALFNLLPAFPMDGGRVLRAFLAMRLPHVKATSISATIGQIFAVLFAIGGLLGNPVLILIGFFVFIAAENEKKAADGQALLRGDLARNAVMTHYPVLSAQASLQAAIESLLSSQARSFLVVDPEGRPAGTLSRERLISALHQGLPYHTPLTQIMDERLIWVDADTPLHQVMNLLQTEDVPFVLVEEKSGSHVRLIGLVDAENIAEYLLIKKAQAHKP